MISVVLRRFVFQFNVSVGAMVEVFVAFDEEILELIGCLQSQRDNELSLSVEKRTKPLLQKIKRYETMTLWQRVKFVFTNKLEG